MSSFYIPQLKDSLPILKECYGFDPIEITCELVESLKQHIDVRKFDELVFREVNGKKKVTLLESAINIDGYVEITTSNDFSKQKDSIKNLCCHYIEDEIIRHNAKFILVFMTAIFCRDTSIVMSDDIVKQFKKVRNTIYPDLLKLFIALNKPGCKHNTPIKICFKTDSPHLIDNKNGWFADLLNSFTKQLLGEITVKEAEQKLISYSDYKGRKSRNPYLNYIIHGTYNFIAHFLKSNNKVTVEQCKFLLEYLKIIGQVEEGDTLANLNTLQSTVRSLLRSKHTPVEKHIKINDSL